LLLAPGRPDPSISLADSPANNVARNRKGINLYRLPPYSPELNLIGSFLGVV
jgi:transposase